MVIFEHKDCKKQTMGLPGFSQKRSSTMQSSTMFVKVWVKNQSRKKSVKGKSQKRGILPPSLSVTGVFDPFPYD